jgi:hypothetical protein
MTNKEKLDEVVKFLDKDGIDFVLRPENVRMKSNLYIPKWKIGVKLEGEDNERYFQTHKRCLSVVFIRESEAVGFVLEKLQNVIVQKMMAAQRKFLKESNK